MRGLVALSLVPLLASASPIVLDTIHNEAAPILSSSNSKELPNSYIVVFKKDVTPSIATSHQNWVQDLHLNVEYSRSELRKKSQIPFLDQAFGGLRHTYNIPGSLLGYSGHFDDEVIEHVRRHPDVSQCGIIAQVPKEHVTVISTYIRSLRLT